MPRKANINDSLNSIICLEGIIISEFERRFILSIKYELKTPPPVNNAFSSINALNLEIKEIKHYA